MAAAAGVLLLAGTVAGHVIAQQDRSSVALDGIHAVVVVQDAGDVTLARGEVAGHVEVTTARTWGWQQPTTAHSVEDGTLTLTADCPSVLTLGPCDVDRRVTVPAGVTVEIEVSSGSVTAEDGLDLVSLVARASSGSIVADGVTVPQFSGVTSSGNVRASFTEAPERVTARSSSGDVELTLPDDAYRVDAATSSGRVRVDVVDDPDATRLVSGHTSSGDVVISRG